MLKKILILNFLIFTFFNEAAFCFENKFDNGNVATDFNFANSSKGATNIASFDFQYVKDELGEVDHIEAKTILDGKSVSCLVDTGARFTIARNSLVPSNEKVGELKGGGVSGRESITDLVIADLILPGWVSGRHVIGRKQDQMVPMPCLLGNDLFMTQNFTIDFQRQKFIRGADRPSRVRPLEQYKSERGGHFGFSLFVNGVDVPSLFDTGATHTVFDIEFVKNHPQNFTFIKKISVTEGSNQSLEVSLYRASAIQMGDLIDKDVDVYVLSLNYLQAKIPGINAVLGLSQMKNRKWYFNFEGAKWAAF